MTLCDELGHFSSPGYNWYRARDFKNIPTKFTTNMKGINNDEICVHQSAGSAFNRVPLQFAALVSGCNHLGIELFNTAFLNGFTHQGS